MEKKKVILSVVTGVIVIGAALYLLKDKIFKGSDDSDDKDTKTDIVEDKPSSTTTTQETPTVSTTESEGFKDWKRWLSLTFTKHKTGTTNGIPWVMVRFKNPKYTAYLNVYWYANGTVSVFFKGNTSEMKKVMSGTWAINTSERGRTIKSTGTWYTIKGNTLSNRTWKDYKPLDFAKSFLDKYLEPSESLKEVIKGYKVVS